MGDLDVDLTLQVGDGPGHPQDAVIAPGGKAHAVKGPLHEGCAGLVQSAVVLERPWSHVGIAVGAVGTKAGGLDGPGGIHPFLISAEDSPAGRAESSSNARGGTST